ncbi:MAG: retention module-containing protein, partial [Shewanella sp.]
MAIYVSPKAGMLKFIDGEATITIADKDVVLQAGDIITNGAKISLAANAALEIAFNDGTTESLNGMPTDQENTTEQENTAETAQADAPSDADAASLDEIAQLQQLIESGEDPTAGLPDTAAGTAGGGQGNNGFITVGRSGGETLATAGFETDTSTLGNTSTDNGPLDTSIINNAELTITVTVPTQTNDTTPTITGTTNAVPGSQVELVVTDSNGNQQTIITVVNPDGTFTVDVSAPLPEGGFTVDAVVTDPNNNQVVGNTNGNVDITPPTITVNAPDATNDTTPLITGTTDAPEGSTVTLVITDSNGGIQTVQAVVDANGQYQVEVPNPLPAGNISVVATVTDPAGNTGTANDNGSIDITAPAAPTVVITEDTNN